MSIEEQQKDENANPDRDKSIQYYYVKRLEIENVRCFGKRQRINFTDSEGNISQWTVILGDNATGKTTLLRSIVSLLSPPLHEEENDENVKRVADFRSLAGGWDTKHQDGEQDSILELTVSRCKTPFMEKELPEAISCINRRNHKNVIPNGIFFPAIPSCCFAYGANRRMAERSLPDDRFTRISETLFKDDAFLPDSSEYFLRLDCETAKSRKGSRKQDRVKELLLKALPEGVQDIKAVKAGRLQREVRVKTDFGWVNLNDLGLGYKTTVAWLIDFAANMIYFHDKSDNPFDEPAILVLDEIDLHMHPAWQREIIANLTKTFPKTQFIVTAHSPLIAQAALNANLVLLKKADDHVRIINDPETVKSWRIDQVLTGDLFGLKEARPKETERLLKRRRELLKKNRLSEEERSELERLNRETDAMPVGETKGEIDAMTVLRSFAEKLEDARKKTTGS